MKLINFISIIGIALALNSCAAIKTDSLIDNKLNQLVEQKEYFKLNELLLNNQNKVSEDRLLYYKAFVTKAFNDKTKSIKHIDVLLQKHTTKFNDTIIQKLLAIKAENYLYNYKYKQAADIYSQILNDYTKVLDSTEIAIYKNVKNLFGAFANVKPQSKRPHKIVAIKSYRNKFNHLMTPVKSNNVVEDFIFDTGANLSTIAESQAKKMDLKMFEQNIDVGSSTQINVKSKLAVADSLYVGDILFENVIFLVMPDKQLTFDDINYKIHGIIGFPVIKQLQEIHLHKNGSITIPEKPTDRKLKNMFLEGLNPIVRVASEKDTLLFTFDTGASKSELSFKFFTNHKNQIEKQGELQTNQRGGAGGNTTVKEYLINNFPIKIGTKNTTLPKISVSLQEFNFNKHFDGNLGQDVITQFNTMIINFKSMYIDFE